MFLVQGAVLLSAPKAEFATFSLSFSYVLMGQVVLSALFGGPLVTLLGNLADQEARRHAGEGLLRLQLAVAVLLSLSGLAVALLIGIPATTTLLVVLGFLGLSFRDALRSIFAAQLRFAESVVLALIFAGVTAAGLLVTFLFHGRVSAVGGLTAVGIGAVLAVVRYLIQGLTTTERAPREVVRRLGRMASWSLPGVVVIWLQNNFYLTLVAINMSLAAVGEVAAARMTIMPILITASGLLRLMQVKASLRLAEHGLKEALADVRHPAMLMLAAGAGIASMLFFADRVFGRGWLPGGYPHLLLLAGGWMLFAAASIARSLYSSLFQAIGRYKELFLYNAAVLPLVLGGITVGPAAMGLLGAVLPMAAGELLLLLLLAWRARPETVSHR